MKMYHTYFLILLLFFRSHAIYIRLFPSISMCVPHILLNPTRMIKWQVVTTVFLGKRNEFSNVLDFSNFNNRIYCSTMP